MVKLVRSTLPNHPAAKIPGQLFNDGSSYRGRIKDKAEEIVPHCFHSELTPDLGGGFSQAEYYDTIARNVKELIANRFLMGAPDKQVCIRACPI